jgi:hypothetical protein
VIRSLTISPEEITRRIGINADKCWKRGEAFEGSTVPRKENVWILTSKKSIDEAIDKQVNALLARLKPHDAKILELSLETEVTLSCAAYVETPPPLFFDKQVIAEISALGASLDVDLYFTAP